MCQRLRFIRNHYLLGGTGDSPSPSAVMYYLSPARLCKKRFCALVSSPNSWNVIILNLPVKHVGVLGRMSQNFPRKPGSTFSLSQGGCSLNPCISGLVQTWPLWRHE